MNNARHQYSATVPLHRVKNGTGGLHVAHVHTGLVGSGGDRVSELEARHLASRGHRVTMIGPTALDIAVRLAEHRIGIVGDPVETRSAQTVLAQLGQLDIVHCHCMLSTPFAAELAQASGAALVIHNHSMGESWWECTDIFSRMRSERHKLRREIDGAVASADRVLCVSEAVRDHMRAIGMSTERAVILPNPIDDVFFRDERGGGEPYDVAVLARPSRAKSPLTALRVLAAASRLRPGLRMIWMGRLGRWEPIMRNFVKLIRLRGLVFAGPMAAAKVCDVLDVTRVLLSASNREGQPLSVLEALSRQCSALLSDIPAHRPLAQGPGVDLFSPGDVNEAGRRLIRLIDEHERRLRPHLDCHRLEVHGQALLAHYEDLIRHRSPRRLKAAP